MADYVEFACIYTELYNEKFCIIFRERALTSIASG